MSHSMEVPALIWDWACRKHNVKNPASKLREALTATMIADITEPDAPVTAVVVEEPLDYEKRWQEWGCELDTFDGEFTKARECFVNAHGSESKAIQWMAEGITNRNIERPRAFIMNWWRKNR